MDNAATMEHSLPPPAARGVLDRARVGVEKLRWGLRVVGLRATAVGAFRLLWVHVTRPPRSEIRLRSGPVLEFDFPSQSPPALVMFGEPIDPEFALLREISQPGWVFVDVGAAIGQFAIFAARLPGALVHAFEPSGANVATLRRNAARNGVADRVDIHQLALSNVEGDVRFQTASRAWMSRLDTEGVGEGERVSVRTLTRTLDTLGLEQIGVLKVNVSGYEPAVLEGAIEFLAAGRADVLIALLGVPSLVWYERIARLGYRFFYYHPVDRMLFEVERFDAASVLDHRPWPARHIIGIRSAAIDRGLVRHLGMHHP
jgi:FkbM family methyltransferase